MREITLDNGVVLMFDHRSVRYFGDYWLMNIAVSGTVSDETGRHVIFTRNLRQMAVPSAGLEAAAEAAVAHFLETSKTYLSRPEFVQRARERMRSEKSRSCPRYM